MTLEEKLEEFKQRGHYSITLLFGEGTGCDDLDVPMSERRVRLHGEPVGVLGEVRRAFVGTLNELLDFDFTTEIPTLLSNPPGPEADKPGYYLWGTERSVGHFETKSRNAT